jgi:hypothetical protein
LVRMKVTTMAMERLVVWSFARERRLGCGGCCSELIPGLDEEVDNLLPARWSWKTIWLDNDEE